MFALILIGGIALAAMVKDKYAVRLGSASGELDGLVDGDRERIQRVVNAMNEAIIKRG
ncbi:MAG TPA: DUF6232 family protein [Anaerolineae bacterium]|nr:DUF6232 family protein [Anaerolineae bacterium]